ncbi:MAG: DUF4384 domain-containing protein [Nitrospiraceae bacterium]|nr:MAG: DUF4384 domain-containing protein [Nitrospiraceae bacterium]
MKIESIKIIKCLLSFFIVTYAVAVYSSKALRAEDTAPLVPDNDNLKIVEAVGEILLGDDTTPAQGRAMARNNARRNALEQAVGVKVHSSTVLYNSSLISDLVVTATKGLIVEEQIIDDGPVIKGDQIYHICKLRAYVKPVNIEKRGNFRVLKAEVLRAGSDRGLKNPVFQDNDEIQVIVSVNEASHINIFSVSQDGMVSQLYPNKFFKSEQLAADKTMIFPDDAQRALGLRLRVRTPKKLSSALESVLVVASKEMIELHPADGMNELMLTDVLKSLSGIDPSLWADMTVGYEVRK